MSDREKLIRNRVISYIVAFGGLILFAIGSSSHPDNGSFHLLGLLLISGSVIFSIATDRCPYCGGKFHRGPVPHYCPHCGEEIF